jgi:hypothetical protein
MNENPPDVGAIASFARNPNVPWWKRLWHTFFLLFFYVYLPFLGVYYVFLRWIGGAYLKAIVEGYGIEHASDYGRFFSTDPKRIFTPEAAAFMEKMDAVVLAPLQFPLTLLDIHIGKESLTNAFAIYLLVCFAVLVFFTIPKILFTFFRGALHNLFQKKR